MKAFIDPGVTKVGMGVFRFGAPGSVKIILGTSSMQRRFLLPVNKKHVIAFTVTHRCRRMHIVIHPDKMAFSFNIGDQVVSLSCWIFSLFTEHGPFIFTFRRSLGQLLIIPRVEAPHILIQRFYLLIIDVIIKGINRFSGLVFNLYSGPIRKRHGEIGYQCPAFSGTNGQGQT